LSELFVSYFIFFSFLGLSHLVATDTMLIHLIAEHYFHHDPLSPSHTHLSLPMATGSSEPLHPSYLPIPHLKGILVHPSNVTITPYSLSWLHRRDSIALALGVMLERNT